jgi:phage terminase large subunit
VLQQSLQISQNAIHAAALLLAQTARDAGVPQDSLDRFLRAGYVPQPKQLQFHAAARECDHPQGPTQVGFGGARGPGKSHGIVAQAAIDDCQRFEGLKVLYLRKIQKNAREQFEDLRRSVLRYTIHIFANGVVHFPNGSRIFLGHFRNEADIDQYLGIEYDLIVIEELTTLSLVKYRALRDSNRTSKPGFRPRIYASFNPGGIGHAWVKATFVVPSRKRQESDTRFIFGTVEDNKFHDPDYQKKLEENTGWRLQAYRYGDWDIAAGQYFSNWRYEAIVKQNIQIMPGSEVWCSVDYGFQHPTTAYLLSEHDGKIQVIDEHWRRHGLVPEHAADIKRMLARHSLSLGQVRTFVAGHDVFNKKGTESGKTVANEYAEHDIRLTRANIDRVSGAAFLLKLLGRDADPRNNVGAIAPSIEIDARCEKLVENIPTLQHDPNHPEDVLKVNIDDDGNGGDDPYDGLRYGIMVKHRRLALY